MVNEKSSFEVQGAIVYLHLAEDSAQYFKDAYAPWPTGNKFLLIAIFFSLGENRKGRSNWWLFIIEQQ